MFGLWRRQAQKNDRSAIHNGTIVSATTDEWQSDASDIQHLVWFEDDSWEWRKLKKQQGAPAKKGDWKWAKDESTFDDHGDSDDE